MPRQPYENSLSFIRSKTAQLAALIVARDRQAYKGTPFEVSQARVDACKLELIAAITRLDYVQAPKD